MPIDALTSVPKDLFLRLQVQGREARRRGQHRKSPTHSHRLCLADVALRPSAASTAALLKLRHHKSDSTSAAPRPAQRQAPAPAPAVSAGAQLRIPKQACEQSEAQTLLLPIVAKATAPSQQVNAKSGIGASATPAPPLVASLPLKAQLQTHEQGSEDSVSRPEQPEAQPLLQYPVACATAPPKQLHAQSGSEASASPEPAVVTSDKPAPVSSDVGERRCARWSEAGLQRLVAVTKQAQIDMQELFGAATEWDEHPDLEAGQPKASGPLAVAAAAVVATTQTLASVRQSFCAKRRRTAPPGNCC